MASMRVETRVATTLDRMDGIAMPLRLARQRLDAAALPDVEDGGVRSHVAALATSILKVETQLAAGRAVLEHLLQAVPDQTSPDRGLEAERGIRMDLHLALGALQDDVLRGTEAFCGGGVQAPFAPVFDLLCGLGEQTECWRNWLTEEPPSADSGTGRAVRGSGT